MERYWEQMTHEHETGPPRTQPCPERNGQNEMVALVPQHREGTRVPGPVSPQVLYTKKFELGLQHITHRGVSGFPSAAHTGLEWGSPQRHTHMGVGGVSLNATYVYVWLIHICTPSPLTVPTYHTWPNPVIQSPRVRPNLGVLLRVCVSPSLDLRLRTVQATELAQ